MKGKWEHEPLDSLYYLPPKRKHGGWPAYVEKTWGGRGRLIINHDPRTGKPWKSMKAARAWFDEVCLDEYVKKIME